MSAALLPYNATELQQDLANAAVDLLAAAPAFIDDLNNLWNPATCRIDLLPYLAWALGVDEWDPDWDEATQRTMVAEAHAVHAIKGTPAAIKRVLSLAGYGDATITEHRQAFYNGDAYFDGGVEQSDAWYCFEVVLNTSESPDADRVTRIVSAINRVKPVRACLRRVTRTMYLHDGTFNYDGTVPQVIDVLYQAGDEIPAGFFDGQLIANGLVTYGRRNPSCYPIYDGTAQFNGALKRG
ncbi:MAG: phage tail protein I [Candidatus Thiodiazotropha sp. (ex Dulcina madagascariensis)]|nr:phage tail protein I [Candidatus Thiodiazotropha sp. (ex Dulcina madagascariensis)]